MTRAPGPLRLVSLFAGIGGFAPVGVCEIDPHARSVLARHWPHVPQHPDVTTLRADTFGAADVVTFGSPCQDLSVAGKRAGLAGERSSLFLEAVRYIRDMLEATGGAYPRAAVWENVPGAFSSNGGRDFAAVLEALVGGPVRRPADGWAGAGVAFGPLGSAEWRVLDSQHFGVAQRRRRVFVVYRPGGERAGEVLLEPEGVRGNPPAGRAAGEGVTGPLEARAGAGGFPGTDGAVSGHVVPVEVSPAVLASWGHHGSGGPDSAHAQAGWLVPALPIQDGRGMAGRQNGLGVGDVGDPSYTIDTTGAQSVAFAAPIAFKVRGGKEGGGKGYLGSEDRALTISTVQEQFLAEPVAFEPRHYTRGQPGGSPIEGQARTLTGRGRDDIAQHVAAPVAFAENSRAELRLEGGDGARTGSLTAGGGKPGQGAPMVATSYAVRRLTPRECERLQAFPDDWTRYASDGGEIADTHRYRMLGNAVTVSVAEWVGRRLAAELVDARPPDRSTA